MKHLTINIQQLIGVDIRSRSNGKILEDCINDLKEKTTSIVLDFVGVTYISRSFADELCEVKEHFSTLQIKIAGMSEEVETMYEIVLSSRGRKRVRNEESSNILTFNDMESLSSFLQKV